jgi:hypothetical protein
MSRRPRAVFCFSMMSGIHGGEQSGRQAARDPEGRCRTVRGNLARARVRASWGLIPNCGDVDSPVPPCASEHRARIPLDYRTFLQ